MLLELYNEDRQLFGSLSIKKDSISLGLGDSEVYSYDCEGRLLTAWLSNQTFVRTLDNRVIKKWRDPLHGKAWKLIQELEAEEAKRVLDQARIRIDGVYEQLQRGKIRLTCNGETEGDSARRAGEWPAKITQWDYARLEGQGERFRAIYTPVTILPPDQYLAVVLQATEGCHWNRCTFCHFYRHTRFRIKSHKEFSDHVRAVKDFFGEGIRLRRSIFLGDANALVIPQNRLLKIFERVNQEFRILSSRRNRVVSDNPVFTGIYSFIDAFTGDRKSVADFRELKARNLRRVYIGAETGCDRLLKFLNKPATAGQVRDLVATVKQADLSVGVIILIGVGGEEYTESHVAETVALLNSLKLGRGDILYFSPMVESPVSEYARRSADAGIRPLADQEKETQLRAIRSGLQFTANDKPKIALYDIREFVY
ncbi:MAG: radical SAM protein [Deltaproteobacteria bacterium]|nr:radical SAM protein [Deltaproteobacteria bacterium]